MSVQTAIVDAILIERFTSRRGRGPILVVKDMIVLDVSMDIGMDRMEF